MIPVRVFRALLANVLSPAFPRRQNALHDMYHEADGIPERVTDEYISWIEAHI